MAERDPAEYRKFLETQAKNAGVDLSKPPRKATIVVVTSVAEGGAPPAPGVVEIWGDEDGEVKPATLGGEPLRPGPGPGPGDGAAGQPAQLRLPLKALGEPAKRRHGALGPAAEGRVFACKAHPDVLRRALEDPGVRGMVVEWAFKFWELRASCRLGRQGRKLFMDTSGMSAEALARAEEAARGRERAAREGRARAAAGELQADLPDGLLSEIAGIGLGGAGAGGAPPAAGGRRGPAPGPLISELDPAPPAPPAPAAGGAPAPAGGGGGGRRPAWIR